MHIVTKATPIQFIDSKCDIRKQKSHITVLSGYYACLSRDLLLMPLGQTHTHTHTYTHTNVCGQNNFKKPGTHGPVARTPSLKKSLPL